MRKHRRKTSHREITAAVVTVVAVGAVGVPSAAMAYTPRDTPAVGAGWPRTAQGSVPKSVAPVSVSKPAAPASRAAARVLTLVNRVRAEAGCSPLAKSAKLTKAARAHSADMASHRNMSHTSSDGSAASDRITGSGYDWRAYGENVARGYTTPEDVVAGWMNSPGHRRNILDCSFKEIGVGVAQPGNYWTQDFGAAR
ncbi:CAP domain-containing protein [Streptomyces sp. NBC_01242]|uniref:CAP domain-containing protein n=1 Tax=unclassified Streptomyces TaxID=2593676 RepID=UPI002251DE60|nr:MULTISPECIES: CAP domain-containing protein [unclassified Streptomyces]MCX4796388.1 CAP domain-containing protein [Streptomyces sp. NBC_01242]WSJ37625.1 CAP domain-containing protein [Streptomyces sp. NBC_01321]